MLQFVNTAANDIVFIQLKWVKFLPVALWASECRSSIVLLSKIRPHWKHSTPPPAGRLGRPNKRYFLQHRTRLLQRLTVIICTTFSKLQIVHYFSAAWEHMLGVD